MKRLPLYVPARLRRRPASAAPSAPNLPTQQPHCNGPHGPTPAGGCQWCDALTDVITLVRQLEREVAEIRTIPATAALREYLDANPDVLREFLRQEYRRNPAWWRATFRREIRAGWLRDDFARLGITDR